MTSFRDISIRYSYTGKGERILEQFLLPVLDVSASYDRITSFYTIDSLLAISQGVQTLYEHGGHMRLIIGVHSFPEDLIDAAMQRRFLQTEIARVRHDIEKGISSITDALLKQRVATLSWMMEDGLLSVKAAAVRGEGIFHPKTLILTDREGNCVAAVGSSNETASGLGGNYEQLMVATSWNMQEAVDDQKRFFSSLWDNVNSDAVVSDITRELAATLNKAFMSGKEHGPRQMQSDTSKNGLLHCAADMPTNFFVSGAIPALYQHQERAVLDALSRWPVRVLLADEVGLGKTFEAAACIAFLTIYCNVKRVLILTPKSVLSQWQDELSAHFGMNAWLFDSAKKRFLDDRGAVVNVGSNNPLAKGTPDIMLMSAQYARGGAGRKNIFERTEAVLPDLLVVDEAHSARVSTDISGKRTATKMYKMLESVSTKIPHLILATATPMQKEPEEYHAMLKLLGLPKAWKNTRNYNASLKLIASREVPSLDSASTAGRLLCSTMKTMRPSTSHLNSDEVEAVNELITTNSQGDAYDTALFVQTKWPIIRNAFIKLHPAHLLTVRNTRRALSQIGYTFPRRDLSELAVQKTDKVRLLYQKIEDYLTTTCFSVERALYPDRIISIGFVRVSYQQRITSSLFSCAESLQRRLTKLASIREQLLKSGLMTPTNIEDEALIDIDEFADDELLASGDDETDLSDIAWKEVDLYELSRAIDLETTYLPSLIERTREILRSEGDPKIKSAVALAKKCLLAGDQVLMFSRYTDTVDATIDEFKRTGGADAYRYGVYTGSTSVTVFKGNASERTKDELKRDLVSGELRIVFCSDAASEGLNLQAARVLINVDVPWTPSRLEQRIGRIARLGQRAKEVDVVNVWYPDSIEAKMYRRIQKRLDQLNLAIGEFPDVVADQIRNDVLDEREQLHDELGDLQELRNSEQTRALEALWSSEMKTMTVSSAIRRALLTLCDEHFKKTDSGQGPGKYLRRQYELPDNCTIELTDEDGCDESISLASRPWEFIDLSIEDMVIAKDGDFNSAAFCPTDATEDSYFTLLSLLTEIEPIPLQMDSMPVTLADTSALSLDFAIEGEHLPRPQLWPPRAT